MQLSTLSLTPDFKPFVLGITTAKQKTTLPPTKADSFEKQPVTTPQERAGLEVIIPKTLFEWNNPITLNKLVEAFCPIEIGDEEMGKLLKLRYSTWEEGLDHAPFGFRFSYKPPTEEEGLIFTLNCKNPHMRTCYWIPQAVLNNYKTKVKHLARTLNQRDKETVKLTLSEYDEYLLNSR